MLYYNRILKILATDDGQEADALMTESDKFKKYGAVVKTYKSSSNPNKTYEVRRVKGQPPTCNCPGWANRRTCKHTEDVIKQKIAAATKQEKLEQTVNKLMTNQNFLKSIADMISAAQTAITVAHMQNKPNMAKFNALTLSFLEAVHKKDVGAALIAATNLVKAGHGEMFGLTEDTKVA